MHDVLLGGAGHPFVKLFGRRYRYAAADPSKPPLQRVLDALQQVIVGLPLVLEGEAAVGDMVQVLQPKVMKQSGLPFREHVGSRF